MFKLRKRQGFFTHEKKVYLAGPIKGKAYSQAIDWREYTKKKLYKYNIIGVSPMRGQNFLKNELVLKDYKDHGNVLVTDKGITARDRFDVMTADVILVNLLGAREVTIGTMIEFGWADAFRKPVVCVMEKDGNIHNHPMVREIAHFIVDNLDDAIDVTVKILKHNFPS
ncbi:MAG: nucleoside 2-deoxyribosyltransferase [Candidatus Pacearchaeota archaeon]